MVHMGRPLQALKEEIAFFAREHDVRALLLIIDELLEGAGVPAHYARMEADKQRALLHSMLPPMVADRILTGETVTDQVDGASILFLDIVDFTRIASSMQPSCVVDLLSLVFHYCDEAVNRCGLTKIKTIGDSYMAVGIPDDRRSVCEMAIAATTAASLMLDALRYITVTNACGQVINARVGLHIGSVIAGVIGTERMHYDVWGDAVNVAARMEQSGAPGRIHISADFAEMVKGERVEGWKGERVRRWKGERVEGWKVEERGAVDIKGKGKMTTYWLSR